MKLCCELFNLVIDLGEPRHADEMHIVSNLKHQQREGVFNSSKSCDWELLIETCT